MSTTINISLPEQMYKDAKKTVKTKRYASISELIRNALRKSLYEEVTENGFTPAFEDELLKAAAEPDENDIVLETEEDIRNYFKHLKEPSKKRGN